LEETFVKKTSRPDYFIRQFRKRHIQVISYVSSENVTSGLFHTSGYVNLVELFDVTFGLLHLLFYVEIRNFVGNSRGTRNLRKKKEKERKRER
jgi:hypothetical protein